MVRPAGCSCHSLPWLLPNVLCLIPALPQLLASPPQVLADPQFLAHSAATLTDLLSVPLTPGGRARRRGGRRGRLRSVPRPPVGSPLICSHPSSSRLASPFAPAASLSPSSLQPPPPHPSTPPSPRAELDLRPYTKLLSVLGLLRCAPGDLPRVLRRLPRSLESLCLTAESLPEPRDFDAGERELRTGVCCWGLAGSHCAAVGCSPAPGAHPPAAPPRAAPHSPMLAPCRPPFPSQNVQPWCGT